MEAQRAAFASPLGVLHGVHTAQPRAVCKRLFVGVPVQTPQLSSEIVTRETGVFMKRNRFHQPLRPNKPDEAALPEDGTPVFAIFVRTNRAKIWYPLGTVKGDDKSKQLVSALKNAVGRALYENALDKGIAQTVYGKDRQRFLSSAIRMYPQLKRYQKDLQFGYKVAAVGLDPQETKPVTQEMILPAWEWAKRRIQRAMKGKTAE